LKDIKVKVRYRYPFRSVKIVFYNDWYLDREYLLDCPFHLVPDKI